MASCVFCGRSDGPLTREHVWGRWMASEFPELAGVTEHEVDEGDGERWTWTAPLFEHTARVVCGSCNNGWMSQNNNDAKPLLRQMIRGKSLKLGPQRQNILATWALKTAMMYEQARTGARPIASSHYTTLHRTGRPPEREVTIWSGMTTPPRTGPQTILFSQARMQHLQPLPTASAERVAAMEAGDAYGITLRVGFCVFQIFGFTVEGVVAAELEPINEDVTRRMRRIWPAGRRITWPPPDLLDNIGGVSGMVLGWVPKIDAE